MFNDFIEIFNLNVIIQKRNFTIISIKYLISRCGNDPSSSKKKLMTVDQLVEFLNKEQRDPRLNEILYPYADRTRGKDIIQQYEPNKNNAQKGNWCLYKSN